MDKTFFLPFIVESLPENFIILLVGMIWIGVAPPIKKLFLIAICGAFFSYFIRTLPIVFGIHSLLQFLFLIFLTYMFIHPFWLQSILIVLLGSIAIGISEIIFLPLWLNLGIIDFQDLISLPWLRSFIGIPHMLILVVVAVVSKNKNFTIIKITDNNWNFTFKKDLVLLIIISFLQIFLFITLNLTFLAFLKGPFPTFKLNSLLLILAVILFFSTCSTIGIAYYMLKVAKRETQFEAEQRYLKGLQELYLSVRSQRHDFLNHVTSIYGLIKTDNISKSKIYIEELYNIIKDSHTILNINIPELSGLLQTKKDIAEKSKIDFQITVDPTFSNIPVTPIDLTAIVGNLVDNSIDAINENNPDSQLLYIKLLRKKIGFIISVTNSGNNINPEIRSKIFNAGFSTKDNNYHSGLGLRTVQKIVIKYGGKITIKDPAENYKGVCFEIFFPHYDH